MLTLPHFRCDGAGSFCVLDLLGRGRHVKEFRVINGLVKGDLTNAPAGRKVGTLVTA